MGQTINELLCSAFIQISTTGAPAVYDALNYALQIYNYGNHVEG